MGKVVLSFFNGQCPVCGQSKLEMLDKYNKKLDVSIYPVMKLHCKKCNRNFFPRWDADEEGNHNTKIQIMPKNN